MADRLLTAREVAARLDLSPETVLRWVRLGELPAFKLGKAVRFREDEIERWLAKRATPRRGVLPATPSAAHGDATQLRSTVLPATEDEECPDAR